MNKKRIAKWLLVAVAIGLVIWLSRSVFDVEAEGLRNWILSFEIGGASCRERV